MLFDWLIDKWSDLSELRVTVDNPDIIAPLGYGLLVRYCLPKVTIENFEKAILAKKHFPRAVIFFGNSSHCFDRSEIVERSLKHQLLAEKKIRPNGFIDVGAITDTVTEAEEIRGWFGVLNAHVKEIILITGQMHARYAVLVWKTIFPKAKITLAVIPYRYEYQPEHIIILQRYKYLSFAFRVAQYIIACVFGIGVFRGLKHPVSHQS